jgi:hypothetical protein
MEVRSPVSVGVSGPEEKKIGVRKNEIHDEITLRIGCKHAGTTVYPPLHTHLLMLVFALNLCM